MKTPPQPRFTSARHHSNNRNSSAATKHLDHSPTQPPPPPPQQQRQAASTAATIVDSLDPPPSPKYAQDGTYVYTANQLADPEFRRRLCAALHVHHSNTTNGRKFFYVHEPLSRGLKEAPAIATLCAQQLGAPIGQHGCVRVALLVADTRVWKFAHFEGYSAMHVNIPLPIQEFLSITRQKFRTQPPRDGSIIKLRCEVDADGFPLWRTDVLTVVPHDDIDQTRQQTLTDGAARQQTPTDSLDAVSAPLAVTTTNPAAAPGTAQNGGTEPVTAEQRDVVDMVVISAGGKSWAPVGDSSFAAAVVTRKKQRKPPKGGSTAAGSTAVPEPPPPPPQKSLEATVAAAEAKENLPQRFTVPIETLQAKYNHGEDILQHVRNVCKCRDTSVDATCLLDYICPYQEQQSLILQLTALAVRRRLKDERGIAPAAGATSPSIQQPPPPPHQPPPTTACPNFFLPCYPLPPVDRTNCPPPPFGDEARRFDDPPWLRGVSNCNEHCGSVLPSLHPRNVKRLTATAPDTQTDMDDFAFQTSGSLDQQVFRPSLASLSPWLDAAFPGDQLVGHPFTESVPQTSDGVLCFFWDLEATGLDVTQEDITQIACVCRRFHLIEHGSSSDSDVYRRGVWIPECTTHEEAEASAFNRYVYTTKEIPEAVITLTGITSEFLTRYGVSLRAALHDWQQWVMRHRRAWPSAPVWFVAHNGNRYDLPLLFHQEAALLGVPAGTFLNSLGVSAVVDTVVLSRRLQWGPVGRRNHRLQSLFQDVFARGMPNEHDALGDVCALAALMTQEPFLSAWGAGPVAWRLRDYLADDPVRYANLVRPVNYDNDNSQWDDSDLLACIGRRPRQLSIQLHQQQQHLPLHQRPVPTSFPVLHQPLQAPTTSQLQQQQQSPMRFPPAVMLRSFQNRSSSPSDPLPLTSPSPLEALLSTATSAAGPYPYWGMNNCNKPSPRQSRPLNISAADLGRLVGSPETEEGHCPPVLFPRLHRPRDPTTAATSEQAVGAYAAAAAAAACRPRSASSSNAHRGLRRRSVSATIGESCPELHFQVPHVSQQRRRSRAGDSFGDKASPSDPAQSAPSWRSEVAPKRIVTRDGAVPLRNALRQQAQPQTPALHLAAAVAGMSVDMASRSLARSAGQQQQQQRRNQPPRRAQQPEIQ